MAETAKIFAFSIDDATQETLGIGSWRAASFTNSCTQKGLLSANPFVTIGPGVPAS